MSDEKQKTFLVHLSFKGKTIPIQVHPTITAGELIERARQAVDADEETELKLLWKGKRLQGRGAVFAFPVSSNTKTPKIMILATQAASVHQLNSQRSDPTIRGFDQERKPQTVQTHQLFWGPQSHQDKNYKFCRFQSCSWQSFGHRPTDSTPHDFAATHLLQKLATDPGIVAILKERELVVGTLGEMDPIDDRLMQKKQQQGACLLGYNTNAGARIDLKLRTDDLRGFRPYPQLASTLIHELSHNWVGEHNLLFWTNFGQMRVEYLYAHLNNGTVVNGQTTGQLAGLPDLKDAQQVMNRLMQELAEEMAQHGLHPRMIQAAIQERCDDLDRGRGRALGGAAATVSRNAREMALAAAERRAKKQQDEETRKGRK